MKNTQKPKTAIITWISYLNFGSFLQAYALQKVLISLGYPNAIISDKKYVSSNNKGILPIVKQLLVHILHPYKSCLDEILKTHRFKCFAQKFLNVDKDWNSTDELSSKYDIFVCGSDQIWAPTLPEHYNGFYFASFAGCDKFCLAYAPSLGANKVVSPEYVELVRPWLKKFKYISIRERLGSEIVSQITDRNDIVNVLDPTLLLTSSQWRELMNQERNTYEFHYKPYMLAYFLTFNQSYLDRAYELAKCKGLQLVCLNTVKSKKNHIDRLILGAGPMEFLNLIANSEFVFTDSFHGTIFALQFHKPFITVKRFVDTTSSGQNTRIENLFNIVGIFDNFLDENTLSMTPTIPDWTKVENALKQERESSISFLKNALNEYGI